MKKTALVILSIMLGILVAGGSLSIFLLFDTPTLHIIDLNDISLLVLGDSYTIGESVPQTSSWPYILKTKAKEQNMNITKMEIIAQTGWSSDDLLRNLSIPHFNDSYDFVFILIGVNDQFQGTLPETYRSNIHELLQIAESLTYDAKHIIIISIPDYSASPLINGGIKTMISQEIQLLNSLNKYESSLIGASYVDINDIIHNRGEDSSMFANDQLHFSGKMYNLWVCEIIFTMEDLLDSREGLEKQYV